MIAGHLLGIAAEKNVGAAAGHVGGHGHGAFAAGLGDDARFALVLLGVENLVRDAGFFEDGGNGFGLFDGDGAHENGLSTLVKMTNTIGVGIIVLHDAVDHGFKLFFFSAVDDGR